VPTYLIRNQAVHLAGETHDALMGWQVEQRGRGQEGNR
jgi:hypothetical protein